VPLRARGVSTCGLALLEQPISQPELATTRCPFPFQDIIEVPCPAETSTLARYVSAGGALSEVCFLGHLIEHPLDCSQVSIRVPEHSVELHR
jgi:hypothetical protein